MCELNEGALHEGALNKTPLNTARLNKPSQFTLLLIIAVTAVSLLFTACTSHQEATPPQTGTDIPANSDGGEVQVDGDEDGDGGPSAEPLNSDADPLQPNPIPDPASLPIIENPPVFQTLYVNPIELLTTQVEQPGVLWKSTLQIAGLRDQKIQQAINDDLFRLYTAMSKDDLPPYRGIYQHIPPGTPPASMNLNAFAAFNFENLLSVVVYCDKTYTIKGDGGEESLKPETQAYVSLVETRNYDLRTGRDVALMELFAAPALAQDRINDEVAKFLRTQHADEEPGFDMGIRWSPGLTTAFKGLTPDQKFYLQPSGITLILDHRTPAFDTGFHPAHMSLSYTAFEGELALRQRFSYDPDASPYIKTGPRDQQFIQTENFTSTAVDAGEESGLNPNVNTHLYFRYPADLPEPLLALAKTTLEESRHYLKALEFTAPLGPGEEAYCEIALDILRVGPFYTLRHSVYANAPVIGSKGETGLMGVRPAWNTFFSLRKSQPDAHAKNPAFIGSFYADGHPVPLESCFQPGVDYTALLTDTYNKQALRYGFPAAESSQLASPMFTIGHTALECYFPALGDYGYMSLSYEDLGSENLTIFE